MVLFVVAIRNLVQSWRRTSLLMLAIGLVTMFLTLLLSISAGIEENLLTSATTISTGHVNVSGFYKITSTEATPLVTDIPRVKEIVAEVVPEAVLVIDRARGWGKVTSGQASIQAGLSGVDIGQEKRLLDVVQLAPESDYKKGGSDEIKGDLSRLSEPGSAMVFAAQARRMNVEVGDALTIQTETASGRTNTADVTVVAVARDLGLLSGWSVFVEKEVIRKLYQLNDSTSGAVWILLPDVSKSEEVMNRLRGAFVDRGFRVMDHDAKPFFMKFEDVAAEDWTGQAMDFTIWSDEVSFLSWVVTGFDFITWFLVAILVVIIAVGIMNAMWNAVRERTREVGTLRAIGMFKSQVLVMFLLEALVLGVVATSLGALGGAVLSVVINAAEIGIQNDAVRTILLADTLRMSVQPVSLFKSIVILSGLTMVSALWPAIRAAGLRPVVAMSHAE